MLSTNIIGYYIKGIWWIGNLCLPTRDPIIMWNFLKGIPRPELLFRRVTIELEMSHNLIFYPSQAIFLFMWGLKPHRKAGSFWWGSNHQADKRDLLRSFFTFYQLVISLQSSAEVFWLHEQAENLTFLLILFKFKIF